MFLSHSWLSIINGCKPTMRTKAKMARDSKKLCSLTISQNCAGYHGEYMKYLLACKATDRATTVQKQHLQSKGHSGVSGAG
jgi:hypothetical protein